MIIRNRRKKTRKQMKIRLLFLGILVSMTYFSASAQDAYAKNIYLEGLGAGLLWSANYDMRLNRGVQDGLGFRAGIGGFRIGLDGTFNEQEVDLDLNVTTFPLQVNYLIGSGRSSLEIGGGITPALINYSGSGEFEVFGETFEVPEDGRSLNAYGTFTLGYRFQPLDNGVSFRVNWSPQVGPGYFNPTWGGISLGYHFK